MTEFLIAYTGPRGGKPKYVTVPAETAHEASEKFIDHPGRFTGEPRQKEVYIEQVYAPVEWREHLAK